MKEKKYVPWLYIAPQLILFLIFFLIPFIYGIYMGFTNYNLGKKMDFIGIKNFINLFDKESIYYTNFWNAIKNTFLFVLISVPLLVFTSLVFAQLLNNIKRFRSVFQSILYIPSLFSVTSALIVWVWLFNNESGIINYYLVKFFGTNISWLTSNPWTWVSMLIATIWWTVGGNMIIFLAGMQEISKELYEAASLDGANKIKQFFHITLPGLKNQIIYATIMTIIASANVFGQPNIMTGGGPGDSTKTISMLIREVAFTGTVPKAGQAAAMSLVFGLMVIGVSFSAMLYLNKMAKEN